MRTFILHIQSATQYERFEHVCNFVAEDDSGSFGILAHHERMMTALSYGLARCELQDGSLQYFAFPGGITYFLQNNLYISTRHFLHETDYQRISAALLEQLLKEEEDLQEFKDSLVHLEQEMFRRLWQMERHGAKIGQN